MPFFYQKPARQSKIQEKVVRDLSGMVKKTDAY